MKLNTFFIIDLETTDINTKRNKILSFSALKVVDKIVVDIIDLRTNIPCPSNHISYKYLCAIGEYAHKYVIERIKEVTKNQVIVGWGIFFEKNTLSKFNIQLPNTVDLMVEFKKLLKLKKYMSLTDTCDKYKIKINTPPHTSLGDCYRIYELLNLFWRTNGQSRKSTKIKNR